MTEILHFPSSLREMARKAMLETSGKPNNISESGMVETLPWAFMKQIPGQEPPPGQVSNFTDPPNLVITVAVVLSISSFLVSVAEGFRIESKVSSARSFTWDDYTSFLATIGSFAYSAVTIYGAFSYIGIHQWNVPLSRLLYPSTLRKNLILGGVYSPTMLLAKLSILLLYLRLFRLSQSTRIAIWIGIVSCTIYYLFGGIFTLTMCSPWPGETYYGSATAKRCRLVEGYAYSTICFNALSDICLVIIPLPVILSLQFSTKKKIRICCVFMLGIFACICGFISTSFWLVMLKSPDKTYWTAPALLASIVELDVGIIAGCMPVIQVTLIRRFAKISQLSPFRCLTRRLFRARSEATTGGVVEYGPDLTGNGYGRPYLETEILHGADGEGNFMSSVRAQTDPQSSWLSFPFRAMGTRTRGQSNKNNPTAAGTLRSDHGGLVTNYVSSAGSSHIDREEEPNRHYMVHVQDIENVV